MAKILYTYFDLISERSFVYMTMPDNFKIFTDAEYFSAAFNVLISGGYIVITCKLIKSYFKLIYICGIDYNQPI